MLKKFRKFFKKIDQKCDQHRELLILLLIVVLLRIPNFFEPYWYGDEAIYLTVGTGLRNGLKLYTDIIDHKTPLIYYLAMVPNQFWFRALNLGWMLTSTAFFFSFAKRFLASKGQAFLSSLIFILLTTLPWLEGHIPNGELFVIGFVMVGLWLLSHTRFFQGFLDRKPKEALKPGFQETLWLLGSGFFFGLGVLTKVPGILDFGAAVLIGWFVFALSAFDKKFSWEKSLPTLLQLIRKVGVLLAGLLIPVVISILYYVALGSGRDYLDYGLLYNFRYSGSWQLGFTNPLLQFLFTLPGKALILAGVLALLTWVKKYPPRFQLAAGWFALALFASLLSNRPYPHYFIQVVPPLALLVVVAGATLRRAMKHKAVLALTIGLLATTVAVGHLLGFRPYRTGEYYGKFYQLLTRNITMEEYDASFNNFVSDNYAAGEIISKLNGNQIFIWGTNPMLYALTRTVPTSRFTVSFHIKDFDDHERTLEQIREQKPKLIVVMNNESDPFPGLYGHLNSFYYPNYQYEHMTLYLLRETPDGL